MVCFKYIHFHNAILACIIKGNDEPHACITKGNDMSDLCCNSALLENRSAFRRFWSVIFRAIGLRRSRRQLSALDDHMLADIGVTRRDAMAEAQRPVWDAQDHWTRSTF